MPKNLQSQIILGGEKMINEKQRKLIEYIVVDEMSISAACEKAGVPRRSYYDWIQETGKTGKEFVKAMDSAIDIKVKESRKRVRNNVNSLLDSLEEVVTKGKNENAKVNAVAKMMNYAELDPANKQEINVTDNKEDANQLLEMWKQKQQDKKDDE